MKSIFITGGNGFVGTFIVKEAVKRGYSVTIGVRSSSNLDSIKDLNVSVKIIDFGDVDDLTEFFKRNYFTYIIHNAGITKAKYYEDYDKVNNIYTQNLIKAVVDSKIEIKKIIFTGSLAANGPENDYSQIILDNNELNPVTFYGRSKKAAEEFIKKSNLPYIIIKPTAVYGPYDKDFYLYFKLIKHHLELYIGFNKQLLSFIYVEDLARIFLDLQESSYTQKTYFASDGFTYTNYDLVKYIRNALNVFTIKIKIPLFIIKILAISYEFFRKAIGFSSILNNDKIKELSAKNWICDISELKNDINFNPEYPLEKGIKKTYLWYKENKWL